MTSFFQYCDLNGHVVTLPITLAQTFEEGQVLATTFIEAGDRIIGMDTESTVQLNPTTSETEILVPVSVKECSTLQLATPRQIGIFQLGSMGSIPSALRKLLMSKSQIKVGVDLTGDVNRLLYSGVGCQGWIDLQSLATAQGIPAVSMADLITRFIPTAPVKNPLGHRGNWDGRLTPDQIYYAATDAYVSLLLYYAMMRAPFPEFGKGVLVANSSESDDSLILNWIKLQLATAVSDRSFKSLVNQIVNSYGPWRNRYLESDRRSRAEATLRRLIQAQAIPFNELRQVIPVASTSIQPSPSS